MRRKGHFLIFLCVLCFVRLGIGVEFKAQCCVECGKQNISAARSQLVNDHLMDVRMKYNYGPLMVDSLFNTSIMYSPEHPQYPTEYSRANCEAYPGDPKPTRQMPQIFLIRQMKLIIVATWKVGTTTIESWLKSCKIRQHRLDRVQFIDLVLSPARKDYTIISTYRPDPIERYISAFREVYLRKYNKVKKKKTKVRARNPRGSRRTRRPRVLRNARNRKLHAIIPPATNSTIRIPWNEYLSEFVFTRTRCSRFSFIGPAGNDLHTASQAGFHSQPYLHYLYYRGQTKPLSFCYDKLIPLPELGNFLVSVGTGKCPSNTKQIKIERRKKPKWVPTADQVAAYLRQHRELLHIICGALYMDFFCYGSEQYYEHWCAGV
eukprot:TRINITY_DN10121_c0_g1_i1.p1 TRINITY_DN10121_c0_g1~~TRINITY_DN10121_c0_g1_i1.p1  ORF type:complete len:376 (+),score=10.39 TRINITY_DN10121_c0_g1_i1:42-1169(+)